MYIEENMLPNLYGCYRCGEINGEFVQDEETEETICGGCGEPAIVSFRQALDLLNDFHLKGHVVLSDEVEELEIIELEFLPIEEE